MTKSDLSRLARRWLPHLAAAVALGVLLAWDHEAFAAISGFRSAFLDWLTGRISQLRGATFPAIIAVLMIVAGFIGRKRTILRAGAAVLLTVLLAGVIACVMKELIARPGPTTDVAQAGASWLDGRYGRFPSSHSAITFGAASTLTAFVPSLAVPSFVFAVLASYERIYRGTHFPSDVFAGIWIGLITARFVRGRLARKGWIDERMLARPAKPLKESAAPEWRNEKRVKGDQEPAS